MGARSARRLGTGEVGAALLCSGRALHTGRGWQSRVLPFL